MKLYFLAIGSLFIGCSSSAFAAESAANSPSQHISGAAISPLHGAMMQPIARQLYCKQQGGFDYPEDGSGIKNEACRAAFVYKQDTIPRWERVQMFNEWPAYSQNMAGIQNPSEKVPDGQLCSAGIAKFEGINEPGPDWFKSIVNVYGDTAIMTYDATQVHEPSEWKLYLSKPGFDAATQRLKWEDLEPLEITKVNVPEESKQGVQPKYAGQYTLYVKIPEGYPRDKAAIIYTQWERNDPAKETFFSCSDVKLRSESKVTLNVQPK